MVFTTPEVRNALEKFERVQREYSDFGAWDSEPSQMFHWLIMNALNGKPYQPWDASDWQLYASSMNCDEAAAALNKVGKMVYDIVAAHKETDGETLRRYAWRV